MRGDGAGLIVDQHQPRTRGFDWIGWPLLADDGGEARIREDLVEKLQACVGGLYGFAAVVEAGERVGPGVTLLGPVRLTGARKSPPDEQLVGVIVVGGGSRRMEPDQAAVVSEEAGVVNEVGAAETAGGVEQQAEAEAVVFRVAAEGGEAEEDAPMGAPLPSERRSEPLEVVSAAARIRTPGRRHNIMLG